MYLENLQMNIMKKMHKTGLSVWVCMNMKGAASNLGIDDQVGDHIMLFQVGISALSVSRLHLVRTFQMLQRHRRDVDPPVDK